MVDRIHRELTDDDIARIAGTYHAWRGDKDAGEYADVPGFCKRATLEEIRKHGHVLTPGRYVGAEEVEDDGEPFEEKMAAHRDAARAAGRGREAGCRHRRQPEGAWVWRVSGRASAWMNSASSSMGSHSRARTMCPAFADTIEVFRMGYIERGGGFQRGRFPRIYLEEIR